MRRRRPLLRAAVVGGVAYHAGKQRAAGQYGQVTDPQYQAAQPTQPSATPPGGGGAGNDMVGQLAKLKELLDAGALTQDEYEAAKRKLLAGA